MIAIVASITVISFNGIQERAQRSAALANLNNAYSKLKVWKIDHNAILPESLEAAGIEQPKNGEIVFGRIIITLVFVFHLESAA